MKQHGDCKEIAANLILDAVRQRASGIHIECLKDSVGVRLRIDGALKAFKRLGQEEGLLLRNGMKELAALDVMERRPQDGRILLKENGKDVDIRVASAPSVYGDSICARILSRSDLVLDIAKAGLSAKQLETVKKWSRRPNGLVLVTGPAGSGKTSLLYMILNSLDRESNKIYTVEDPVEYAFEGISQMPIAPQIGLTFPSALRAVLRQDPDIIMAGEIRDSETVLLLTEAALTGHLVLSTLHTDTATGAAIRMKDIGVEPFLLRDSLVGVVSMRLVRALCKECRKEYAPDAATIKRLGLPQRKYYKAVGCESCKGSGYVGRVGIYELFEPSEAGMGMLINGCSHEEFRKQAISEGMATLLEDGLSKAAQGITTIEEVMLMAGCASR